MNEAQQYSINPVFAGHLANQLREDTDDLHRVFDNLLEIAKGEDPTANGYDRLRATRILYDRGFGKVTKNIPRTPAPRSSQPPKSEESQNHTNHSSDNPNPEPAQRPKPQPAASDRLVERIEQKLDDILGPPQTPDEPQGGGEPCPERSGTESNGSMAEGFVPDPVRDAQYYVLEITNYGADLRSILMSIHEPDPEDTSIRACHRITAGQMIIDRVLGPAASIEQALAHPYDPSEDPYWALRNPADVDSEATIEELTEADRMTRNFVRAMRQEDDAASCEDCEEDDDLCEYHDPDGEYHQYSNATEEEIGILARAMKSIAFNSDRLYIDPQDGTIKVSPRNYIDDS